ncbi:radical SAM protein [Syntrophothermus lipocalidus]|uniref:Radical SAM domain protein n=1 Tax=Syntrophothermus lipocalidus (strain DSM 12680 / TGB-C1) TaxID=643648 RepID=D7CKY5_SYNLT|nr:radical SAM protein [Syntrophothermus lipocalidus]ADI01370.1 Radical SAM domain protein [Syntrophothermus lipocalidus DSM 12680]
MRYEGDIYRPPSEARSYILQCTIGCSHNGCTFCGSYKGKKYRVRSLEEIKTDIRMAKIFYGNVRKVFLADGDAMAMDTPDLLEVLEFLYSTFPSLYHVGIYAGPQSILRKSKDELRALRDAGLTIAYLGVETGDEELLQEINKGVTYDEMVEVGKRIVEAKIKLSVTVLLGLAGSGERAHAHAAGTARICNEIKPDYLAALTLIIVPGTVLHKKVQAGEFKVASPMDIIKEMRILIEGLEIDGCEFRSNHASNYLPIKGRLQEDKQAMLAIVDYVLEKKNGSLLRPDSFRAL